MNVNEAMNKDPEEFDNINVQVWAKCPRGEKITLEMDALVALEADIYDNEDFKEYKNVWYLEFIKGQQKHKSNQEILDMINSWYRCPAPLEFRNTEIL